MRLYAIPAYARTYRSADACLKDWNEGKDFKIACGPYFSVRDMVLLKANGYREIKISEFEYASRSNLELIIQL